MELLNDALMRQFLEDPKSLLVINTANLSTEMSNQPSLYARASYLYSMAKRYTANCKMAMEIKYAQIFRDYRVDNAEKTCDTYVKDHPDFRKIRQMYIDAEHQEFAIRALVDGLQHKKDMLIQLGATLRQEMITRVAVMEEQAQTFLDGERG
jgi:hypothetical protein